MGLYHSGQDPAWRLHYNAVSPYLLLLPHKLIQVMPGLGRYFIVKAAEMATQAFTVTNKTKKKALLFLYLWPGFKQPFRNLENRYFQGLKGEIPTTEMHGYCPNLHAYCQNSTFIKNIEAFL
jgi:hypothetical protein